MTAASTAISTVFVSSKKSMKPGVSTNVMSTGPHDVCAKPTQTDCRWPIASGSQSVTVVPSRTEPRLGIAPQCASSASTSVVLPA